MERRVFEAALRAAAKVTIGTSLWSTLGSTQVGCGGVVTIETSDVDLAAQGGDAPTDRYAPDEGGGGEGGGVEVALCAQPAEPPGGWAVYDKPTFDCCVERIDALAPDSMPETFDEDVSVCCSQLLNENYSAIWSNEPLVHEAPQEVIDACCSHSHGNVGCTPWGPPVPIAMDPGDYVPWVMDELGEHPVQRVA